MKEKIKLPGIEGAYDETISDGAVEKSASLKFLDRASQSIAPKTYGRAKTARKYLSGEEKTPTAGDIFWSAAKGILHYVFPKTSEKHGPRVLGRYWDPHAYSIIESTAHKNLSGKFGLEHTPAKYGSIKYNGKDVWGKQDGHKAYYIEDFEEALGETRYRWIRWRSGLSDQEFKKAGQDYIKFHEEVEAAYQIETKKAELSEFEHGKIQAYLLKSLKALGKYDVYKVGVLIDGQRNDIFGHYIKEHAPDDVLTDIQASSLHMHGDME